MLITKISTLTGVEHTLDINTTQEKLDAYNRGDGLIQEIFPELTPDEREFLMTGITGEEWESFMGDEED